MRYYTIIGADLSTDPASPRVMWFQADDADHAYEQYVGALASEGVNNILVCEIYRGRLEGEVDQVVSGG